MKAHPVSSGTGAQYNITTSIIGHDVSWDRYVESWLVDEQYHVEVGSFQGKPALYARRIEEEEITVSEEETTQMLTGQRYTYHTARVSSLENIFVLAHDLHPADGFILLNIAVNTRAAYALLDPDSSYDDAYGKTAELFREANIRADKALQTIRINVDTRTIQ